MSQGKIKKYCLVTGGAGFIGSHVVDCLINRGKNVVVLDDLSGGFLDNVNKKAIFIKGSITNVTLLDEIFKKYKIEYIFHLAAYAAEGLSHFIRRFNYKNNLIGSVNLINCAINNNVKCFVFTSSAAVYGKARLPMVEDFDPSPEDPYGIAKYAVELDLIAANKMFGLNYVIFRPHNVYGERQNIGDKYRNVIGIFVNKILKNEDLIVFGDGQQKRAFTYIDDVAPYIADCINRREVYNNTFNIGADKPYTINQLVDIVVKIMGSKTGVVYVPARNEVKNVYSSHLKFRKFFSVNKNNFVSLEEGIRKMTVWTKDYGSRNSKNFKNIEILVKLPKSWLID